MTATNPDKVPAVAKKTKTDSETPQLDSVSSFVLQFAKDHSDEHGEPLKVEGSNPPKTYGGTHLFRVFQTNSGMGDDDAKAALRSALNSLHASGLITSAWQRVRPQPERGNRGDRQASGKRTYRRRSDDSSPEDHVRRYRDRLAADDEALIDLLTELDAERVSALLGKVQALRDLERKYAEQIAEIERKKEEAKAKLLGK